MAVCWPAVSIGNRIRFDDFPAVEVTATDISDFTDSDQVIHRPHCLVKRRVMVKAMELVKVNKVGLQSPQAGLNCLADVFSRQAFGVGRWPHAKPTFGRDHEVVALPAAQPTSIDGSFSSIMLWAELMA